MKAFLILLGIIVVAANAFPKTSCGSEASHHLFLGKRQFGDRILYSGNESMDSFILRVKSKDFVWPPPGHRSYETITRIEVHDKFNDGEGGCAFLSKGGVGHKDVTLHLKTQRGGKYEFHILIFGK